MPDPTFRLWPDLPLWILRLLLDNSLRYFLFAGITWIIFYDVFLKSWRHRKVIPSLPSGVMIRQEILHSMSTIVIYALTGVGTVFLIYTGRTQFYLDLQSRSMSWFFASFLLAILVHDTWFYWTHRLLHSVRTLKSSHRIHHESTNPTPWTAYSFSPIEAVLQSLIFPLLFVLLPLHLLAFALFLIWMMTWNVVNHAGFEYTRPWMTKGRIGRLWMTPTGHVMHHEQGDGNFGLYFTFWDRLMGTLSQGYDSRLKEIQTRSKDHGAC